MHLLWLQYKSTCVLLGEFKCENATVGNVWFASAMIVLSSAFQWLEGCMSNRLTINNRNIVRNKYIFRVLTSVQEMKLVVRKRMTLYPDARRAVFLCIFTFLAGMNKNLPSWRFSPLPLVYFVCDWSVIFSVTIFSIWKYTLRTEFHFNWSNY